MNKDRVRGRETERERERVKNRGINREREKNNEREQEKRTRYNTTQHSTKNLENSYFLFCHILSVCLPVYTMERTL